MNSNDAELIVRLKNQDREAWETVVNLFYDRTLFFCGRYVKTEDEARDLTHDTFLKAKARIDQFDSERFSSFLPWLWQIAKYTALDYIKIKERRDRHHHQPRPSESTMWQSQATRTSEHRPSRPNRARRGYFPAESPST